MLLLVINGVGQISPVFGSVNICGQQARKTVQVIQLHEVIVAPQWVCYYGSIMAFESIITCKHYPHQYDVFMYTVCIPGSHKHIFMHLKQNYDLLIIGHSGLLFYTCNCICLVAVLNAILRF